jgi:hypothetical protein
MDAERWKRVDDLLQSALQVPAAQQEEFLRQQFGGTAGSGSCSGCLMDGVRHLDSEDIPATFRLLPR